MLLLLLLLLKLFLLRVVVCVVRGGWLFCLRLLLLDARRLAEHGQCPLVLVHVDYGSRFSLLDAIQLANIPISADDQVAALLIERFDIDVGLFEGYHGLVMMVLRLFYRQIIIVIVQSGLLAGE